MDYPVPDFGQDHLIKETINSEKDAQKIVGHKWDWKETKPRDIVQYIEHPLDVDMQTSLSNLKAQEGVHGNWDLADVQLETESDPICSSAGCT